MVSDSNPKMKMEKNPETQSSEDQNNNNSNSQLSIVPVASLSLALSTILPKHFFENLKLSTLFSQPTNKVKLVPTQAYSLTHLSLSSISSPSPKKLSFKSTISSNSLQNPLSLGPRLPMGPSSAAAACHASILWFCNDLRVHDNKCLNAAHNKSMSVLPIYCFDPRNYGKSSSDFDKIDLYRATFLIESVVDLRQNLQARGFDLVVRIGRPETALIELAKKIGIDAMYAHMEVLHDKVRAEERIEKAMKEENMEVKYF